MTTPREPGGHRRGRYDPDHAPDPSAPDPYAPDPYDGDPYDRAAFDRDPYPRGGDDRDPDRDADPTWGRAPAGGWGASGDGYPGRRVDDPYTDPADGRSTADDGDGHAGGRRTGAGRHGDRYANDRYADDEYTDDGYADDPYAGGSYARGPYAGARHADDHADGRYADDGSYADDGYADGRYADDRGGYGAPEVDEYGYGRRDDRAHRGSGYGGGRRRAADDDWDEPEPVPYGPGTGRPARAAGRGAGRGAAPTPRRGPRSPGRAAVRSTRRPPWVAVGAAVLAVVAVLVLGFVAPGWFVTRVLDPDAVQGGVAKILTESYAVEAVADVRCPGDVQVVVGATFTCDATVDGDPVTVPVRVTGGNGDYEVGRPT